jgi:hypothetical protein
MYYYLEKDHSSRSCPLDEWSSQLRDMNKNDTKHVAHDKIDNYIISTIWLGLDHNYFGGRPMLFETMIFKDNKSFEDIYMDRYFTWDEALKGHEFAIHWVKNGCKNE